MISNLGKRRDRTGQSTSVAPLPQSSHRAGRRLGATSLAILLLSGCASSVTPNSESAVVGFRGGVVADEPRAALIGRDVLSDGGTAADAATAMFFAMAVTLPTSVGLGGAGICVTYAAEKGDAKVIDFLPVASAGGSVAVPTAVRGFAALQSGYGRLKWSRLVQPAEALARFGTTVSRAFAVEAAGGKPTPLDAASAATLLTKEGYALPEGASYSRVDLAATLGRIRSVGPGDFYNGSIARALIDGANAAGLSLTAEDLRGTIPVLRPPATAVVGDHNLVLPTSPSVAGVVSAALYQDLDASKFFRAKPEERPPLLLAAVTKALTASAVAGAAKATPGAGLVAVDRFGNAVSCALTMGVKFGLGKTAGETGVLLAPAPTEPGAPGLSPLLVINEPNKKIIEALVATAGPSPIDAARTVAGPIAIQVMGDTLLGGKSLQDAIERPRLSALRDGAVIESDAGDSARVLAEKGAKITAVEALGRVDAIFCPSGMPSNEPACEARSDPRGAGLAAYGG